MRVLLATTEGVCDKRALARACRDLVQEGFPLNKHHIPAVLENIGDHEQDVIETIVSAVSNARSDSAMCFGHARNQSNFFLYVTFVLVLVHE